jgi:hypothetical protein
METLKEKWDELDLLVKIGVGAAAALVTVLFVVKVLPALVAGMGIGLLLVVLFVPYWIPTIIAFYRKHPSKGGIFALNMFFGWTFLGWVVSLVWALSDNTGRAAAAQSVVVNTTVNAGNTNMAPYPNMAPYHPAANGVAGHQFNGAAPTDPGVAAVPTVGTPADTQTSA